MALQIWFPLAKNAYNYGAQKVIGYITPDNSEDIENLPPVSGADSIKDGGVFGTHFIHPERDDYAPVVNRITNNDVEYIDHWTASVWLKAKATEDAVGHTIYDFSPSLEAFEGITFWIGGNTFGEGELKFNIVYYPENEDEKTGTQIHDERSISFTLDTWHHFCFIYDNEELKMYVDNTLVKTYSDDNVKLCNYRHSMWFESSDEWSITDWRWYDTALDERERTELYYHADNPSILYNLGLIEPNDIAADNNPKLPINNVTQIESKLADYIEWYYRITSATVPHLMNIPTTDKVYDIDLDTRIITPPDNVGVTSDQRAEVVYFRMNRFYQGYDLTKAVGIIEYINAANEKHIYGIPFYDINTFAKYKPSAAYDADVYEKLRETEKVAFPWVISSDVTRKAGNVVFAISFWVLNDNKDEVIFRLNLLPAKTIVKEGIEIDPRIESLIDDITLPTVEQLLQLFESITDDDYCITWDEGQAHEVETEVPYLERMTLPPV